ncbi:MAG: D-xylose transport ATP-binding protein XylG [Ilumatobacteraceae bacterium]|nr:D-xylose transport ATP-binding protein XylG [Ilumatobacteraceae bacterium]
MAAPALVVEGVSKRFKRHRVLDDVSLTVAPGELVALVGENGAGKTTLVRCIAGLIPTDRGEITVEGVSSSRAGNRLSVVWQDLALCDNLDVVANLFLGRELGRPLMSESRMHSQAHALLESLDVHIDDLHRVAGQLSGGQRQGVAIARALLDEPGVLVLDEPTSALGVAEAASVQRLMRRLRRAGVAMLLVSHNLDQVFALADRVVVLRHGKVVADVATNEVHPDDIVAMITGAATDSAARKQLHQLHSLVDQLAEVQPAASLPLIVSALSSALAVNRLCVHLVESSADGEPRPSRSGPEAAERVRLVRRASVGLPDALAALIDDLPLGSAGGLPGVAGARGEAIVIDDLRTAPTSLLNSQLVAAGVLSAWAMPVLGATGLIGVVSAYADRVGTPSEPQLELARLYSNLAASAIEREHLLDEVTRRNRILESLRSMLDRLAGPSQSDDDIGVALLPLCIGIGARAAAIFDSTHEPPPVLRAGITSLGMKVTGAIEADMRHAAELVRKLDASDQRAQRLGHATVAVPVALPGGAGALVAIWPDPDLIGDVTFDLLDDAARTLGLAIERQDMEEARKESSALRRSSVLQREFLMRLSHELRTPLTAIHGYASTLRQTDVHWDEDATGEFLERIATESARMGRLVADLLDSSVIETGGLRLQLDWCDVELIINQAVSLVPDLHDVDVTVAGPLPAVWADHDRLEQVVVNVLANAVRHGAEPVSVHASSAGGSVTIRVVDSGRGITPDLVERLFEPYVTGSTSRGTGIGLAIVRGIVEAHGGAVSFGLTDEMPPRTELRVVLPVEPTE